MTSLHRLVSCTPPLSLVLAFWLLPQAVAWAADDEPDASPAVEAEGEGRGFLDRLDPFADLRLRYENQSNRPNPATSGKLKQRNRGRVRFRIGANFEIHPELTAGFRVRTGNPDDPNSPHQTFGNVFDSFEINLDKVFLRYQPSWLDGAWIVGGKFAHPFVANPVYGELVWDADVNPEGGALGYRWKHESGFDLGLVAGGYALLERTSEGDSKAVAVQATSGFKLGDDLSARVSLGWIHTVQLDDDIAPGDNNGNLTGPGGSFISEFSILNPILSLTYGGGPVPVTISGEYIWNADSASVANRDDEGWAVGIAVKPKLWGHGLKVFYQYARVEQEAIFSPVVQDDFLLGTNFRGHVFGAELEIVKKVKLRAWGLLSEPIRTSTINSPVRDNNQTNLRLDLNVGF